MAQSAKHKKSWTPRDIAFLKEHYRKGVLHRDIAKGLKRTLNAVESKATELGLVSRRRKRRRGSKSALSGDETTPAPPPDINTKGID